MTPELRAKALQWSDVDWKLYRHFNQTFWEKAEAYRRKRMAADVAELGRRNLELMEISIEGGHPVESGSIMAAHWREVNRRIPFEIQNRQSLSGTVPKDANLRNSISDRLGGLTCGSLSCGDM